MDSHGNVLVADSQNNAVKEVPFSSAAYSSAVVFVDSGFSSPSGIAVDRSGNVFVADYYNNAVKEILLTGADSYDSPVTLVSGFSIPEGRGHAIGDVFVTAAKPLLRYPSAA